MTFAIISSPVGKFSLLFPVLLHRSARKFAESSPLVSISYAINSTFESWGGVVTRPILFKFKIKISKYLKIPTENLC